MTLGRLSVLCAALTASVVVASAGVAQTTTEHGIVVHDAVVLAHDGSLTVELRRWEFGGVTGRAWHASMPLSGRAAVSAEPAVVAFDDHLPSTGSWAAINGGFYDVDGTPMGVSIEAGQTVMPYTGARGGSGVFEVDDDGPRVVHRSSHDASVQHALQSIDRIVSAGVSLVNVRPLARAAARSAVVICDERIELVVLAGDGSIRGEDADAQLHSTSGRGLPLWAFAEYLIAASGAVDALNLDGSVSTQLAARVGAQTIRVRGVLGTPNAVLLLGD